MTIVRYEPWSLLTGLQRDAETGANGASVSMIPDVDVVETKDRYVVTADLPGVAPGDIEVTTEQRVLTIRAGRKIQALEGERRLERAERVAGTFVRRFTLPEDADLEAISARSQHGVLELSISKHARLMPRRISVEAA